MYSFAFDNRTLKRELRPPDFKKNPQLLVPAQQELLLSDALLQATNGFHTLQLNNSEIKRQKVYQLTDMAQTLLLRKLNRNIKRLTASKQADRNSIVKSLKVLLTEGQSYRVYKIDIRNFYESIRLQPIVAQLQKDIAFPNSSLSLLKSLGKQFDMQGVSGLPRGIALSATLSEYAMRSFDKRIRIEEGVYFYARYVDDIVIVTTNQGSKKTFLRKLATHLPNGLEFNISKMMIRDFATKPPSVTPYAGKFSFLGYQFVVSKTKKRQGMERREVTVDLSPGKVKRLKTRMCLSCIQFGRDGNFDDFRDRLVLLSTNYNMYDYSKHLRRNVGIYWNYRHIDFDDSDAIRDLDNFIRKILLSPTGRLSRMLNRRLTRLQRQSLLKLSFSKAYENRTFVHFNTARLTQLVRCWKYE